jgi:hypothetical protein
MNRLLRFLFAAALALFVYEESRAEEITDGNSLKVVVVPTRTHVRIGQHFTLKLRVENHAHTNQYVRVMSCGWPLQWKSSSSRLVGPDVVCTFNAPISQKVPAGGSIKFDLEVSVPELLIERIKSKLVFQMGFTPVGSKRTLWSKDVVIHVSPAT